MKRFILLMICSFLVLSGCGSEGSESYKKGKQSETCWESAFWNLRFNLPQDWSFEPIENRDFRKRDEMSADWVHTGDNGEKATISIVVTTKKLYGSLAEASEDELVKTAADAISNDAWSTEITDNNGEVSIAGETYKYISGKITVPNTEDFLKTGVAFRKKGDRMLMIRVLSYPKNLKFDYTQYFERLTEN